MVRLPTVGGDVGGWGTILNDFLGVSLNADGTIQPTAPTAAGAVTSVNTTPNSSGNVTLTASNAIMDVAPSASLSTGLKVAWTIQLDQAELRMAPPRAVQPNSWGSRGRPAFDLIAFSELSLRMAADQYGYEGRSHSLWYCGCPGNRSLPLV